MHWAIFCIVVLYLALVKALRFRRVNAARTRFRGLKCTSAVPSLSTAQEIAHVSLLYDMPFFGRLGASASLFRTYGIPSIAATLLKTGEMTNDSTITKRMTDTAILISSFVTCPMADPKDQYKRPPKDPCNALALARMNYIHGHYKISNDDFLYTMSVFIFGTADMMGRCDWRPMSAEELECLFVLWTEIGRRMGIRDIPATVEALRTWSEEYETEHLVPSEDSSKLAQIALSHICRRVPNLPGLRRFVLALFICLMDERLRTAMMLPAQPAWAHRTLKIFCRVRATFIRTCCLPRRNPRSYIALENPPSGIGLDGRMRLFTLVRQFHPWYYPVPQGYGIRAIYERVAKALSRGEKPHPGAAFMAQGYRMEELGPRRYENDGHARVFAEAEKMHGAPIEAPWARADADGNSKHL
ncbi:hypothetical protein DFH06DRAFT_1389181 [Mycena polygramma]|nr:hypothetical protein DFH06DRAFT_1389181 [Mycena polygramma]